MVEGYQEGGCGEYCEYDPAAAKALLEQAGGFEGTLTLSYNADGAHKEWTEAACISITNALDDRVPGHAVRRLRLAAGRRQRPEDDGHVPDRLADGLPGAWTTSWRRCTSPTRRRTTASYSNPEFDALIADGVSDTELADASDALQEAEEILAEDMPVIPLWTTRQITGYGETVSNVQVDPFSKPVLTTIEKN